MTTITTLTDQTIVRLYSSCPGHYRSTEPWSFLVYQHSGLPGAAMRHLRTAYRFARENGVEPAQARCLVVMTLNATTRAVS